MSCSYSIVHGSTFNSSTGNYDCPAWLAQHVKCTMSVPCFPEVRRSAWPHDQLSVIFSIAIMIQIVYILCLNETRALGFPQQRPRQMFTHFNSNCWISSAIDKHVHTYFLQSRLLLLQCKQKFCLQKTR